MNEPTVLQVKDIQDAVAKSLHLLVEDEGDVLTIDGETRDLSEGDGPGVNELRSNQFEVRLLGGVDQEDDEGEGEFEDVLVVTVAWRRRRKV